MYLKAQYDPDLAVLHDGGWFTDEEQQFHYYALERVIEL